LPFVALYSAIKASFSFKEMLAKEIAVIKKDITKSVKVFMLNKFGINSNTNVTPKSTKNYFIR